MALDMIDPCGYNSKELSQKDLNDIYNEYLTAYKDAFKDAGFKYISEFKPDYINEKTEIEQNLLFLEYLEKCNLELPKEEELEDKLKKKILRQRRLIQSTTTGKISPAVYAEFDSYEEESQNNALLFALMLRNARKKQLYNAAKRTAIITRYFFYLIIFILLLGLWMYIIFY